MGIFNRLETRQTINGEIVMTAYTNKAFEYKLMPDVINEFARKYVEENYDELIKQIDLEAFKQQLTIALATQAAIKAIQ